MSALISIEEAKKRILQRRMSRQAEWMSLLLIRDQVLAEEVKAPFDSPRFDNSAMDGIAVKWDDVKEAGSCEKVTLRMAGESSAGGPYENKLLNGQAIRISTGAVVPDGADTVIPQEDCVFDDDQVTIQAVKKAGQHVRKKGEEYEADQILLDSGTPVTPAVTGVLGSIGMDPVKVYKTPGITLLVTGSELTRPTTDQNLAEGEIYDSNRPMIAHYLKLAGIDNIRTVWVKDHPDDVRAAIRHAKASSDLIISTGGISVGPHDHIPDAVQSLGFETVFTHVAQKPGKPFLFATHEETLYFGLPGNPVSAFMLFTWYVYPEIRWYLGIEKGFVQRRGRLTSSVSNNREKSLFLSAVGCQDKNQWQVNPLIRQASHKVRPLADANGFMIVPPHKSYRTGEAVLFYFFPYILRMSIISNTQ